MKVKMKENTLRGCVWEVQQHLLLMHSSSSESFGSCFSLLAFLFKPQQSNSNKLAVITKMTAEVKPLIKQVSKITMKLNSSSFHFWPSLRPPHGPLGPPLDCSSNPPGFCSRLYYSFMLRCSPQEENFFNGSVVSGGARQIKLIVTSRGEKHFSAPDTLADADGIRRRNDIES